MLITVNLHCHKFVSLKMGSHHLEADTLDEESAATPLAKIEPATQTLVLLRMGSTQQKTRKLLSP